MERLKGINALRILPFSDVLLSREEAIRKLFQHAGNIVSSNTRDFISLRDTIMPWYKGRVDDPDSVAGKMKPGGLSLTDHDYDLFISRYGNLSFKQALQGLITEVFPKFLTQDAVFRQQGTLCFNYLLDLLSIINPKVASFEEGVSMLPESIDEDNMLFNSHLLGTIVADVLERKGTEMIPFEFYADLYTTERFKQSYLLSASIWQKLSFTNGLNSTAEQIRLGLRNISTN